MDKFFKIIGERLSRTRQNKNLTQEKLAEITNLHRNHIGYIERAEKKVTLTTLIKITKALDISFEELFKDL